MHFTLEQARQSGGPGLTGWVYNDANSFSNASAAYFEVTGRHGRTKSTKNDRVYHATSPIMKLFLTHTPSFDPVGELRGEKMEGVEGERKSEIKLSYGIK